MIDKEMFGVMREKMYSGVLSDTLDEFGFKDQAMRENIRTLNTDWVVVGRAKTILAVDIYQEEAIPYEKEIEAIDSILPDEVVVASTNQSVRNGLWGELVSTASKARGANGAIIDGLVRDTKYILEIDFPVFCTGTKPVDSKGRGMVIDYDCSIICGGVHVEPNDVIFADRDGVVVIPNKIVDEVVQAALKKVESENLTREELRNGKLLKDVFAKYGVL